MLYMERFLLVHQMGLGKTVSTIATIEELIDDRLVDSCLVLCPASVKWQWARQIKAFTDGALVCVIEGNKYQRQLQYRQVKRGDVEYVIMNYEQVVNDWDTVQHLVWDAVVCDEATAIKSFAAKRTKHIKRIKSRYRYGLTGQPIENRAEELFSILEWVNPDLLGPFVEFDHRYLVRDNFGRVKYCRHLNELRERIGPVVDRQSRAAVQDQLPKIVEETYFVDLDTKTERVYQLVVQELLEAIYSTPHFGTFSIESHYNGTTDDAKLGAVMPKIMALRMLCNHPKLLAISADAFDDPDSVAGSQYAAELRERGLLRLPDRSPKADATVELVQEILEESKENKVVMFSFFKPMLRILQETLGVDSELFTGDQTARQRDAALQRFQSDPSCRVLFSSDAGGIGVDMPAANFCISYDHPWSAGKFAQRRGRIDRISSKWESITLISMAVHDSIEERILDMLRSKAGLASAFLDGTGVSRQGTYEVTLGGLAEWLSRRT